MADIPISKSEPAPELTSFHDYAMAHPEAAQPIRVLGDYQMFSGLDHATLFDNELYDQLKEAVGVVDNEAVTHPGIRLYKQEQLAKDNNVRAASDKSSTGWLRGFMARLEGELTTWQDAVEKEGLDMSIVEAIRNGAPVEKPVLMAALKAQPNLIPGVYRAYRLHQAQLEFVEMEEMETSIITPSADRPKSDTTAAERFAAYLKKKAEEEGQ